MTKICLATLRTEESSIPLIVTQDGTNFWRQTSGVFEVAARMEKEGRRRPGNFSRD